MWPSSAQIMAVSGVVYCLGALTYARDGKLWMTATLVLYAMSIVTLYMAGDH